MARHQKLRDSSSAHLHSALRGSRGVPARRRRSARSAPRRGIIMLIVLVMLALFTMLLITFVVTAVSTRTNVGLSSRVEQTGDPAPTMLNDAFLQVVRGSRDGNSVIGPHSLLEDIYGHVPAIAPSPLTSLTGVSVKVREDLYTGRGARGVIDSVQQINNGTSATFTGIYALSSAATNFVPTAPPRNDFPPIGFYNGLVITMLDGPAAGRSSRIVGYHFYCDPNSATGSMVNWFQVLSFDGIVPNVGDHYLINGRPFSGTGFGFRPSAFVLASGSAYTRLLDAIDPSTPGYDKLQPPTYSTNSTLIAGGTGFHRALLPNPRRGVFSPVIFGDLSNDYADPAGPGGANEDYDAVDYQNMILALRLWGVPPNGSAYQLWTPLPSLHRPDLLNYWNNRWSSITGGMNNLLQDANQPTIPPANTLPNPNFIPAQNLLRKIVLRPLPFVDNPATPGDDSENPNFTGSNASMTAANLAASTSSITSPLINGPWDVDNDGDGTPDSIWVDIGLPVQTAPDGRRYKPLAAVLVIDMDGKLNLNAHSGWQHTAQQYYDGSGNLYVKGAYLPGGTSPSLPNYNGAPQLFVSRFESIIAPFAQTDFQFPQPQTLRQGSGYGPAEISLSPVFDPRWQEIDPNSGMLRYSYVQPTGELAQLLGGILTGGSPTNMIDGRYGEIGIGSQLAGYSPPAGVSSRSKPGAGVTNVDDPLSWLRETDFPRISTTFGTWPQAQLSYLPTTTNFGGRHNTLPGTPPDGFTLDTTNQISGPTWIMRSGYGTPSDLDGNGMLALDLRGQPLYIDWLAQGYYHYYAHQSTGTFRGWGNTIETVDDPYEIDLSLNAPTGGYGNSWTFSNYATTPLAANALQSAGFPTNVVSVDAPFTATELERLLRWHDGDAPSLPNRLIQLAPVALTAQQATPNLWSVTPPNGLTRGRYPYYPELEQVRNLLTTHSSEVPVPSMVFTSPEHAWEINTTTPSTADVPPIFNSHISQLLRQRIQRADSVHFAAGGTVTNFTNYNANYNAIDVAISQLLAPELLAGEKLNINRMLGNGFDDNTNNAVDDPLEASGESGWGAVNSGSPVSFDLNNDGRFNVGISFNTMTGVFMGSLFSPVTTAVTASALNIFNASTTYLGDDAKARQLLARHLYVLMMLLKDDNFVIYADLDGDGYSVPVGTLYTALNATDQPKAASDVAYYFAQWAVNIVDFRDQDSIMTPFEFDIFPFVDNDPPPSGPLTNYASPGVTWDVDGILSSTNIIYIDPTDPLQTPQPIVSPDDAATYRGLVWGAERPELLITETVASHDRRTRDTNWDDATSAGHPKKGYRQDSDPPNMLNPDPDYDQVRRPQGSLFIELFNPNPPFAVGNLLAGQAPNELYARASQYNGGVDESGAPIFGVDLAKRAPAVGGLTKGAPVWRLATLSPAFVAKSPQINAPNTNVQNLTLQQGAVLNPLPGRQPVLPYPNVYSASASPHLPYKNQYLAAAGNGTVVIDRVAYFTPPPTSLSELPRYDVAAGQTPTLDVESWRQFFAQTVNSVSPANYAIIPPNRYAVIGPAAATADPYEPGTTPAGLSSAFGLRDMLQDTPSNDATTKMVQQTKVVDSYYRRIVFNNSGALPTVTVYNDKNTTYTGAYAGGTISVGSGDIKPAIGIPLASMALTATTPSSANLVLASATTGNIDYSTAKRITRFSLTEPSGGYPIPTTPNCMLKASGATNPPPNYDENGYYDPSVYPFPDTPYDNDPKAGTYFPSTPDANDPLRQQAIAAPATADSTRFNYSIVVLQRLANPTLPWDASANPYIVVDQMSVDLTTYNSEKYPATTDGVAASNNEYDGIGNASFHFDSRQRSPMTLPNNDLAPPGSTNLAAHNASPDFTFNNIWFPYGFVNSTAGKMTNTSPGGSTWNNATWGYLNNRYGYAYADWSNNFPGAPPAQLPAPLLSYFTRSELTKQPNLTDLAGNPLQFSNSNPANTAIVSVDEYVGDPTLPFPWLNWNDRPYVCANELMLVPVGSPSSLLAEMTVNTPYMINVALDQGSPQYGAYEPRTPAPLADLLLKGEFGHLPNIFHSPALSTAAGAVPGTVTATSPNPRAQFSPNFYRLLEYVQVPSRFVGTESWLRADAMQGASTFNTSNFSPINPGLPDHQLHPPFNRVSRFRAPGKVNINTIADPFVMQGIVDNGSSPLNSTPPWVNLWNAICDSRLGTGAVARDGTTNAYLQTSISSLMGSVNSPSIFAAPFRSYAGHTLVPIAGLRTKATNIPEREIDATLMRGFPTGLTTNFLPLLEYPGFGSLSWRENASQPNKHMLIYNSTANPPGYEYPSQYPQMDDPAQNPYFAYQAYRRYDNLLTTRSNVYAIWITIGNFEVTPAPTTDPLRSVKYPDGWVLGQEIGSDTGDIKRHRAFYMYDRSIPVGFERGENHNVQRGILLERIIE